MVSLRSAISWSFIAISVFKRLFSNALALIWIFALMCYSFSSVYNLFEVHCIITTKQLIVLSLKIRFFFIRTLHKTIKSQVIRRTLFSFWICRSLDSFQLFLSDSLKSLRRWSRSISERIVNLIGSSRSFKGINLRSILGFSAWYALNIQDLAYAMAWQKQKT